MENRKLFEELLYLGLGTAVITGNKIKGLLEKLVDHHKLTEEEGEKALNHIISKSKEIRNDIDEFTTRFSDKTKVARKDVEEFLHEVMNKPKQVKENIILKKDELWQRVETMAKKVSVNTNLKVEEAREVLMDFVNEISSSINKARFKAEEWIEENKSRMEKTKIKGKEIVEEIKVKSHRISDDLRPGLKGAMNKTLKNLHLVSDDEFSQLEERVQELEKKELVK